MLHYISAFVKASFSNWKKQFKSDWMHEESQAHINSKIVQLMFLQQKSMTEILEAQEKVQEEARQHIEVNREIMKRVIDTIIIFG